MFIILPFDSTCNVVLCLVTSNRVRIAIIETRAGSFFQLSWLWWTYLVTLPWVQGDEIKNCETLYSSRRGSLAGTTSRPCPPPSATLGTCTGLPSLLGDPPESFVKLRDARYWICLLLKKNQVAMFMHLHVKMV